MSSYVLLLVGLSTSVVAWYPAPKTYSIPLHEGGQATQKSLYPLGGAVKVLDGSEVLAMGSSPNPQPPQLIAMYASWCPHCWHLVPHWVNVARAFTNIKVSALNCADNANRQACDSANVTGYPTIQCYGCPKSKYCNSEQRCEITVGFPAGMSEEQFIQEWISNATAGALRPTHPEFLPAAHAGQRQIDITGPPGESGWINAMYLSVDARSSDAMRGFLSALWTRNDRVLAYAAVQWMTTLLGNQVYSTELLKSESLKVWNNEDLMNLASSLKPSDANTRGVLQSWASQHGFGDLSDQENFATYEDGRLSVGVGSYQSCTDFTCALWEYLHITTLLASHFHRVTGSRRLDTVEVMTHIRWFVKEFLACADCKRHFLESYDNYEFARPHDPQPQDWKAVVLWLWRVHEGVSLRTAADADVAEDRRWPPYDDCPACWKRSYMTDSTNTATTATDIDIQHIGKTPELLDKPFNLDFVYAHLQSVYLGSSVVQDKFALSHSPVTDLHQSIPLMPSFFAGVTIVGIVASLSMRFLRARSSHQFLLVREADESI